MKLFEKQKTASTPTRQPVEPAGRAPVYSYRSMRNNRTNETRNMGPNKATGLQPSALIQQLVRRITIGLTVAILLFGLWLKPTPQVTIINQPGTVHRQEAAYKAGIQSIWNKRLLNQTKLTIQADQLSSAIEQLFPEIESASVELPLLGQLPNVVITPASPILVLVTQKGAFYVAENGKTMARSDQVKANQLGSLPTVRDDSGIVPEPGRPALPIQQIETVIELLRLSQAANLELDTVVLPLSPNQVDITVKGSAYSVKFSLTEDPKQGIGALLAVREKFAKENITPTTYLDLRVPDKAFYR